MIGTYKARGLVHHLGKPEPFLPEGTALGERTKLGMAPSEQDTGFHGGRHDEAEVLVALRPVKRRDSLAVAVDRPTIVALGVVGEAEAVVR